MARCAIQHSKCEDSQAKGQNKSERKKGGSLNKKVAVGVGRKNRCNQLVGRGSPPPPGSTCAALHFVESGRKSNAGSGAIVCCLTEGRGTGGSLRAGAMRELTQKPACPKKNTVQSKMLLNWRFNTKKRKGTNMREKRFFSNRIDCISRIIGSHTFHCFRF